MSNTSKTAKIIKRWYYSAAHWHLGDVLVGDVNFLWFLLFLMCYSLHVAVNVCINCSFFHLFLHMYVHTYVHTYVYLFFRGTTHRSDLSTDFDAWWLKRREITQGCAFWGLQKLKVTFNPFRAPKRRFLAKNGLGKISTENRLQWALPRVKYP